jgi:type IV secretory pathway VirB2 component (pilin)
MILNSRTARIVSAAVPLLVFAAVAAASATTTNQIGTGNNTEVLPWEGVLSSLAGALTGVTAKIICVIAIFVAGVALIFGEDMGHFAKRLLMIVIAAAFLIGAGSFVNTFISGAHI